jgi:hypothetical protein
MLRKVQCKSRDFREGGDVGHNHDKGSEASLNRQILNNFVKRKAVEGLRASPRKPIHRTARPGLHRHTGRQEGQSACALLPAASSPKNAAETREALSAVPVLTSSKEQFLLVNYSEKNIVMFSRKTNLQFLSSIDSFTLMGHSDQLQSFSTNCLQFMGSTVVTVCHLHFSC